MTSESPPTTENQALLTKIGAIEQEIAAVKKAVRRASFTRLLLLLAVLAFLAASVWMFYGLALELGSKENLDLLAAKARERVNESSKPALDEFNRLVENCKPVLTEAFQKQAEADMPKYTAAFTQERDTLMANLESRLSQKITARYQETGERCQAILREEFPQVEDPELLVQVYTSIEGIMEKLVEKYYSEQVRQELQDLQGTWDDFDMADVPTEGAPPLEQQFMASLLQLAADKLDKGPVFESAALP
ncbi:MAG: hypothetical protein ABIK89_13985 [Planctomycetota bacterium]